MISYSWRAYPGKIWEIYYDSTIIGDNLLVVEVLENSKRILLNKNSPLRRLHNAIDFIEEIATGERKINSDKIEEFVLEENFR